MGNRVKPGRILGDAGNDGALGEGQGIHRFIKIPQRGSLNAQGVLPQVDGIHVIEQNLVLGHGFGQFNGQVLLLDLSFHTVGKAGLTGPVRKDIVLQELLGDGTGTLRKMELVGDAYIGGPENTLDVNAVVLIETLVLNGNESVCQILRNHILGHGDPVGILGDQLGRLIALQVINKGRKAGRRNLDVFNAWRSVYNTLKYAEAHADTNDTQRYNAQQGKIQHRNKEFFPNFG